MQIDARELDIQELLKKLKEILSSSCGSVLEIDVLVNTLAEAKKITGFVSMSGLSAEIDKKDNYLIIHVRGIPCCT